jgi:hypothetical protein
MTKGHFPSREKQDLFISQLTGMGKGVSFREEDLWYNF